MNSSRTTRKAHAFRLRPLNVALAALALLPLLIVAPAGADPDLGDCQKLRAPVGNQVALDAFGVGVQIYRWNGASWDFVAPEAVLYAGSGDHGIVATHFAGPTWQSVSGSKVVGAVIDRCTPDPNAIPWLLLGAASREGPGIFAEVSYIQRLHTVGGKAPTNPGSSVGEIARVPYTAEYVFYQRED